ncbi:uncharacterized protein LOC131004766 [Salvia miltiorrhiza]|uniref:uncharacterized protein LOC131004766 n=1 Tax=Salvia miltiorrhiza TaxID=226208 RepID=UPI0025AD8845|nr:uncharacterized protein LOC131004766 [Salvia miltiorrhiza]XP_057787509.1 uncharacterized protein LOC131004766 [Salvia miltiorrhiza]XP_057787510.1 uncharacterized protein LOC131004766 [Salvia miltiorrhiza]
MAGESSAVMKESCADLKETADLKEYEGKVLKDAHREVTKCADGFLIEYTGILADGEDVTWIAAKNITSAALLANRRRVVFTTPTVVILHKPEWDVDSARVHREIQLKKIAKEYRADLAAAGYDPQEYEDLLPDDLLF